MIARLLLLAGLVASSLCFGNTLTGQIVSVADGDTVTLLTDQHQQVKIRLNAIDAPEKAQAFGMVSKKSLSDLCFDKSAVVESEGKDRYGRTIGMLTCDGVNANEAQIKAGMAWVYRKYSHDARLIAIESEAKASGIGLWADTSPIPPWEFRHSKR